MSAARHVTAVAACFAMLVACSAGTAASREIVRLPVPRPPLATDEVSGGGGGGASTVAQGDGEAPLPHPRPAIEPKPEVAEWARDAETSFQEAAAASEGDASSTEANPEEEPARRSSPGRALAAIDTLAPLPHPRPARGTPELALMMPPRVAPQDSLSGPPPAPEDAGCIDRLRALGAEFTEEAPIDVGGTCSVPHPLRMSSLGSGVSIGPETILNCAEAESLAHWMKEVVVPSATRLFGSAPNRITQDSAYVCRTRYNDPHEKISEHAHANAIDIAAFDFADRDPIGIGRNEPGSPEARFEAEIRKGSCTYFTTVLGPGSNAAHATHFHLDMEYRRGGYRLCELGAPSEVAAPANTKRE